MAAGLGFKTFTTGEVLTAADTNGYLMQGVLVFASSAARAAAITSPQEGQYSYLKDTNSTEYYDGAAWIAAPIGDITGVTAGTGISGGGTSGTVTITNSMATEITAAGDIIVGTGSGTFDNLPIGTTGQLLTADTTVSPYKVKWATPAASSSGLTLVSATTFSAVSSHSVDDVFTSTYKYYRALLKFTASGINKMTLGFRAGGTRNTSANYYSVTRSTDSAGTNEYASDIAGTTINLLAKYNTDFNGVSFDIFDPQAASDKIINGVAFSRGSVSGGLAAVNFGGSFNSTSAMDGLQLIASAGTISGTLKIYGYQN